MSGAIEPAPDERAKIERRFVWAATIVAVFLAAIPAIYAQLAAGPGKSYLGFEFNTDDHMVYAAWMRQAMDGHFFFDNRFTTDQQPGLTVHLYFWVFGLLAKVVGIPIASNLARLLFTGLFVPLLYRLVRRVSDSVFVTRLAIALTVFGGGIGFFVWHNFGREIVRPGAYNDALRPMLLGRLPIDVWQPEAFVFPSMLTNGLFMVSLCLILVVFQCFLDARESWKPVAWGALALGVLMNIHSYDVLMIAFAMVGFLAMQLGSKRLTGPWLGRGVVIALAVVPAALWFSHVLKSDPVFQARAATPTYTDNFRQIFFGYVLMFLLALPGFFMKLKTVRARAGLGLFCLLLIALFIYADPSYRPASQANVPLDGYFLSAPVWVGFAVLGIASLVLMATDNPAIDLLLAWAVMGLISLYFPALFQRKLAMGLSVPWAILATLGFAEMVRGRDRNARNLTTILALLLLGSTSIFWIIRREPYLIRRDVSSTTVHPVFLNRDESQIVKILGEQTGRTVVLAMPGAPSPDLDAAGKPIPDEFNSPAIPDLNPIVSGLSGVYTYAGHWSETPNYDARRRETTSIFLAQTAPETRAQLLARIKPDYLIAPSTELYGHLIADLGSLGKTVYSGSQFKLIKLSPE